MKLFQRTLCVIGAALLPTTVLADWSGVYGGVSAGRSFDAELTFDDSSLGKTETEPTGVFGGFAGYQFQNEQVVYGAEIALSRAPDIEASDDADLDMDGNIIDLKGRIGYAAGNGLIYGVAGLSSIMIDSDDGEFDGLGANFGVGYDFLVAENIVLGAEYLIRRTTGDDDDNDFDIDSDVLSIRAAYKF
ncbi:outer membrane beta-barrel protein [Yoonia sp. GPGPB17]|uniref:outer membrane protein n=1 Tax=Yoonia sp. GPGPB17 TaxID=3026147 RepID=UPI0030C288D6